MKGGFLSVIKESYIALKSVVDGRMGREKFWMFVLYNVLISVVLICLGEVYEPLYILLLFYLLVVRFPSFFVTVRRLHDVGRSGWWWLLYFVPGGVVVLFVFFLLPGTNGVNKFGEAPE